MPIIHRWEKIISEGKAKIIIPDPELFRRPDGVYEPAWSPVFYNPIMTVNRDFTSLFLRVAFREKEFFFVEPLGGTGIRGIRIALETRGKGIINDIDPVSFYYIRRNIELNNLDKHLEASLDEANSLLNSLVFSGIIIDYVDIDPYGSPIPFIDSSVRPLGKHAYLGVTATDTGPLTCSHAAKALRRYGVRCCRTDFMKELGLRILIYNIVFRAASQDVALDVLVSYSHLYYYRVLFKTYRSGRKSYEILDKCRGYIWYCPNTLERGFIREPDEKPSKCLDNSSPVIIGPLWICRLNEPTYIDAMIKSASSDTIYTDKTIEILSFLKNEAEINKPYVRYDKLFGRLRKNMPPRDKFIEILREHGFKAYRSHFDPRGIVTNADIHEIYEIIKEY